LSRAGLVFMGSTAIAGVAPPIATSTNPTFALWNPLGSGKNLVMLRAAYGYISGTVVASAWHYSQVLATGSVAATGSPVLNFTAVAAQNALVGAGGVSVAKLTVAAGTTTLTAASMSVYRHSGISNGAPITSTTSYFSLVENFEGDFIIPPGVMIFPSADPVQGGTYAISWLWAELPV
jgi:hypothetical protein